MSYLPLSHIAGNVDLLGVLSQSDTMNQCTYFGFPDALQGSLTITTKDVKPTLWIAVPRVWEKLQAGLQQALTAKPELKAVPKVRVGLWCCALMDHAPQVVLGLVGLDQVKHALVGAAPTSMDTFDFFDALGLQAS